MFSNREKKILTLILNANNGIYGSELAKVCNLSDRTIRNEVKRINQLLIKYNCKIESSNKTGYSMSIESKELLDDVLSMSPPQEELNQIVNSHIPNTSEERIIYISLFLLFANSYVTLDYLANLTYVSKTTVRNTIKSLQDTVQNISNLELEISPIKGIKLNGLESKKRYLLSLILSRNYENNLPYIKTAVSIFVPNINAYYSIYDTYSNAFDSSKMIFTDKSIILFSIETIIFLTRSLNNFTLENFYKVEDYNGVVLPYKEIEQILDIQLTKQDKDCLIDTLSYKKVISISSTALLDSEAASIIQEFFTVIKRKYGINLNNSLASGQNFTLHINTLIQRIKHEIANDHQFIRDIKEMYPFSFELASNIIPIIQNHYGIKVDESELSFIAIHLSVLLNSMNKKVNTAIVCSNDISESKLIELSIITKFSEKINFIGNFPIYQLDKLLLNESDIDLVITTIPYTSPNQNVAVINVSSQLTKNDIYNLENYFLRFHFSSTPAKKRMYPSFDKRCFKIYEKADEKKVLTEMVNQLYDLHFINDKTDFTNSIMERENIYPTIYGNIWLPHPLEPSSNRTVFSIAIIKTSKKINLIILCAVKEEDTRKFKYIFDQIAILLSNSFYIKEIIDSSTFEEFIYNFDTIK